MISFALLDKNDLKVLFEDFKIGFLRKPLKKPAKTLLKYVPNGFRIERLQRNMLIQLYCDAVSGKEPSISEYVKQELSQNFNDRGINDYWNSVDFSDPLSHGLAVSELQSVLLENGFSIPSYIVFLLYGVECNEKIKDISKKLFDNHVAIVNKASEDAENRGRAEAETGYLAIIDSAEKKKEKQQKRIGDLESQLKIQQDKLIRLQENKDELEEELCQERELVIRDTERIDSLDKQIIKLKNENQSLLDDSARKSEIIHEYDSKLSELELLNQQISDLQSELLLAKEKAYSDEVIQRLCSEVLDELRASSLSENEILKIAKKRFTEADTIVNAWVNISNYSEEHIQEVIDNIVNLKECHTTLDMIEEIEDGILIKFAILKVIKSILYNELEAEDSKRTISDKFAKKKD